MARRSGADARVFFYRGMWVHEAGEVVFVDSPELDYGPWAFKAWVNQLDRLTMHAKDHWFHVYGPRPGDVILDVGAGKGEDTIIFSRAVGPQGRVISIEAHPATFACLRLFCELNGLNNVTVLNAAVTDRAAPVVMGNNGNWQESSIVDGASPGAVQVTGETLDEILRRENLTRIDFLKMNIEGAEHQALKGMRRTLGTVRALCISCHDFRAEAGDGECFRTKVAVDAIIRRAGFEIVSRDEDPRPYVADQVNAFRR
jgi:FkbM family methyltransferase